MIVLKKIKKKLLMLVMFVRNDGIIIGLERFIADNINRVYSLCIFNRLDIVIDCTTNIYGLDKISIGHNVGMGKYNWIEAINNYAGIEMKARIVIGNNVSFSDFNHIGCTNYIEIGDNVLLGSRCYITDHNHGIYMGDDESSPNVPPIERHLTSNRSVVIEDNVWIGDNVVVLPGVRIGYGAVIGANAVVSHDIPEKSIAVGVPARVIKRWSDESGKWEKEKIKV